MPAAPAIVPLVALNVPVPRPPRLMPSFALLVELTASNASVAPVVPVTSTAGPPVALRLSVPAAGTDTVPALDSRNAGAVPLVVVSARSPNVVVPVVFVRFTPPLPEPVTVIVSNTLVPMLVPLAPPVATRPAAPPLVVMEIVPAEAKLTVPALLSRTPVAPLVLTVRFEMLNVPAVESSSRPGCVPAVPVSAMLTSSIVPPPVSPDDPAMPPPVPCGSMLKPRTSSPSSRSTTSALLSVSVGLLAASAACRCQSRRSAPRPRRSASGLPSG